MTDTAPRSKYVPSPEGLNQEFYEAAMDGIVRVQTCQDCGTRRHPPRYTCPVCRSRKYSWTPVQETGRLYSWTVVHRAFDPGWLADVPYAVGIVELADGVRLVGLLEDADLPTLELGAPLDIVSRPKSNNFAMISFVKGAT